MSDYRWSAQDVADKADSEGGVLSAYYWGLRPDMIADPELAAAWARLAEVAAAIDKIRALLPEPSGGF